MNTTTQNHEDENSGRSQARAQLNSVLEMVAALECDFNRLEELRDAREELREDFNDIPENDGVDFDSWARHQHAMTSEECDELAELEAAAGDCRDQDAAQQRIYADALSVEVRSGWQSQGETLEPEEFRIVLCTGGPHCQLVGELQDGEPTRVWMEYSDWGTGLIEFPTRGSDNAALLTYAQQFYFGE